MTNHPAVPASSHAQRLLNMKGALIANWNALGIIYSNNAKPREYPNNPQATLDVMQDVHHLSGGLSIVFMMALLESHINPDMPKDLPMWNAFLDRLDTEDRYKLLAFKHIRNTMAHGLDGKRATRNPTHFRRFDEVMARPHASARIHSVRSHDHEKIILSNGAGIECFQFLEAVIDRALQAELRAEDSKKRST